MVPIVQHSKDKTPPSAWALVTVFLLALVVYANSLRNDFAYDDLGIIKENPRVMDLEWSKIWADNYWGIKDGIMPDVLYRPLTIWSYLANQALTPDQPWAFHLVNVILHGLVSVLVAMLTWRLLGKARVAVLTGLLFAVHPLHTEVVANVVGRAELMACVWYLLALLMYLPECPLAQELGPQRRGWGHGLLIAGAFFAAMLGKETPAPFIGVVMGLDLWRYMRWNRSTRPTVMRWFGGQAMRYYLPLMVAMGAYLAMRLNGCGRLINASVIVHPVVNPLVTATPMERVVTPFALLGQYLALTFWPVHLSADYSFPSLPPTANLLSPLAAGGFLACVLVAVLTAKHWRRFPEGGVLVGLFLASYCLVANVMLIGTIFGERLFYTPSMFVLMVAAWGLVSVWDHVRSLDSMPVARVARVSFAALMVVGFVGMGWRTVVRNTDWEDNIHLAIATGRDNPGSAKACNWAGSILLHGERKEHVELGRMLVERSVELAPTYVPAHWELAKYFSVSGDVGRSLQYMTQAALLEPGLRLTRMASEAVIIDMASRKPETYMPTVADHLEKNPQDPAANLAMAMALRAQHTYDGAEKYAKKAIELYRQAHEPQSEFHEAVAQLASIEIDRGEVKEGLARFRQYVVRLRNSAPARVSMARLLLKCDPKQVPNALEEAEIMLKWADALEPGNEDAREERSLLAARRAELGAEGKVVSASPGVTR